jgi:hypothetical protein
VRVDAPLSTTVQNKKLVLREFPTGSQRAPWFQPVLSHRCLGACFASSSLSFLFLFVFVFI